MKPCESPLKRSQGRPGRRLGPSAARAVRADGVPAVAFKLASAVSIGYRRDMQFRQFALRARLP